MEGDLIDKLNSFELSEKVDKGVSLLDLDIAPTLQECKLSLIGKVYGKKKINFTGLKATLGSIWMTKSPFSMKCIGHNLFHFLSKSEEDLDKILNGKTWSFDSQYILFKKWSPGFLDVLVPAAGSWDGQLVKILVEMNLNEPIPRGANVKLGQDCKWVDFRYEHLQTFCYYCGKIGHNDRGCSSKKEDINRGIVKHCQYGDWLKATLISFLESKSINSSTRGSTQDKSGGGESVRSQPQGSGLGNVGSNQGTTLNIPDKGMMILRPEVPEENLRSEGSNGKGIEVRSIGEKVVSEEDLNESQLMDITVQSTTIDGRVLQRKKKPFVRKPRVQTNRGKEALGSAKRELLGLL
ncbi:Unknown protein [Striga hermonthica]|uniref:CCHC-type domain-containing protein n=1 Tax=Striga hermonthica TaxID=68872 RepID=A0A9N7RJV9_STRHE|nr:Unknown protein [Striga hermonthica]